MDQGQKMQFKVVKYEYPHSFDLDLQTKHIGSVDRWRETNFEPVQSLVSAITKAHHLLIVVLRMFLCFAGRKSSPILSYTTHSSSSPKNHPQINQKEFYCVFAAFYFGSLFGSSPHPRRGEVTLDCSGCPLDPWRGLMKPDPGDLPTQSDGITR